MSGPVRRRPQSRRRSVEFGKEMGGMFQKIIVPVDGSESSWRALEQGLVLADKFGGEVVVLTVIQPYNNAALLAVPLDHNIISQSNNDLRQVGEEVLHRAEERVKAGSHTAKVSYEMEVGHPSERILRPPKRPLPTLLSWAAAAFRALRNSSWAASARRLPSTRRFPSSS